MTAFLSVWLAAQAVSVLAVLIFCASLGRTPRLTRAPRVAVLVAVKGHNVQLDPFLRSLFDQDYPDYRVIFAVESGDDPAAAAIEPWRQRMGSRVALVVAGLSVDEGQKTRNLLAAVSRLEPADEVQKSPTPISSPTEIGSGSSSRRSPTARPISSPASPGWSRPTAAPRRSSWHRSPRRCRRFRGFRSSTPPGAARRRSRARRSRLGVAAAWRGTLSDDLQLTAIAQRARCRIAAPPDVLPRTLGYTAGFAAVAAQARRWYMLVRVYLPVTYVLMLAGATFIASGWVVALAGAVGGSSLARNAFAGALLRRAARRRPCHPRHTAMGP